MESILMIVMMMAVFYFLIIRPENKRKKSAEEMRNSLRKGDRITTIGGMVGKIVQVNTNTVVFETSDDRVRIEIAKWGIQSTEAFEMAAAAQKKTGFFKPSEEKAEKEEKTEKAEPAAKEEEKSSFDPEIK